MAKTIVILVLVVGIGFALYLYGKKVAAGFDFNSGLSGVNFGSLINGSGSIQLTLTMSVTNTNSFGLTINNLNVQISYQGTVIANTTSPITQIVIPSVQNGGYVTFPANISIQLNDAAFAAAGMIATSQTAVFNYKVTGSLYAFPFSFSGTETYPS